LNPHVIVTNATRAGDAPADGSYLTCRLAPAGTTPSACRQTRIAQLVNDLDPKLTAAALGMRDSGLVRYLADNVARDRLQRPAPADQPGDQLSTWPTTMRVFARRERPHPGAQLTLF